MFNEAYLRFFVFFGPVFVGAAHPWFSVLLLYALNEVYFVEISEFTAKTYSHPPPLSPDSLSTTSSSSSPSARADPGFFLPTSKKNSNKNTGGKVVKYGFGNLFDFDYLIRYLRKLINIFTYS